MKKLLLTFSLSMMTMVAAWAVPAKPGLWKTIRLENGTELRVQLCGDEHAHYWQAANGQRFVEQGQTYREVSLEALQTKANTRRAKMSNTSRLRSPRKVSMGDSTHYEGQKKGLVILAQFSDVQFKPANNLEKYKKIMNEVGYNEGNFKGSVADYFKAQSAGQFELNFDVVGPYTMPNNQKYYGQNNSQGDDQHPEEMVVKACQAADTEVNFADYDWDGDGEVDQVFVLYAGKGEADGGGSNTIWPHMYYLSASNMQITLDGVKIDTYACSNEIDPYGSIEGIGCFCHEFSHCMGFPDFYDTSYSGWFGMSDFDLMCGGSYNGGTFCPAGYTAHEKMMCGWQKPIVLSTNDTTVTNIKPMSENGDAYIIYNNAHPDEYFMIENRQKTGWDASYPAKGLMVTHVDFDKTIWEYNIPNTQVDRTSPYYQYYHVLNDHQRMTIMHADNDDDSKYWNSYYGGYTKYTLSTDLYPYSNNDSLTATSKPAIQLYNANENGKKVAEWAILNITQNSNGTMSFNYRAPGSNGGGEQGDTTHIKPETDYLFYESFDQCVGTGGNDGHWSDQIAMGTFTPDNEGWDAEKPFGANGCAKFGTSSIAGVVTTPTFTIEGTAKLTFKAGAWNAQKDGTELKLQATGATLSISEITLEKGKWNDYEVTLTGSGDVKVTFEPTLRFFLDEVLVVKADDTDCIQTVKPQTTTTTRIYTLDGRYMGTSKNALPKGIYVMNGKKFVK